MKKPPIPFEHEAEARRAEHVLSQRRAKFETDMVKVLQLPEGRSWFHRILAEGHMWGSCSHPTAMVAASMSGQRDLVLAFYRRAKRLCPNLVAQMEAEHCGEFQAISTLEGQDV